MLRDWWRSLEGPPESLTARQRSVVIAAAVAAAITRLFALARTPWDWDELLFMQGLDHFDVASHRPHPPGYPLYIVAAKVIRKFGFDDFHALQALSLISAMLIVPAMFFLCRELRARFSTSIVAGMLLAFFPNVWFYGGAAFSDVPAMVLITIAAALLFAGCRDARAYVAGALLLGVSAGVRPQALMIGFVPMVIASWFQIRKSVARVLLAIFAVGFITAASYGGAAWLTGWEAYHRALQVHGDYIVRVDSFRSPVRPPLWRVFDDFFVMPYHAPAINFAVTALVLISFVVSLLRRRGPPLAALAAFAPFCVFTWLILDRFSASRFSIAYAPLMALLAADGLRLVTRRPLIEGIAAAALVGGMIGWTWPALRDVRTIAPSVAAVDWIRNHVDRRTAVIYVDEAMVPFAEWYLPDYHLYFLGQSQAPPAWSARRPGFVLREDARPSARAVVFTRAHDRLWQLARQRYFDVSVRPVTEIITFGNGWYEEESGGRPWRWMAARSTATLPPIAGNARLSLSFYVPLDALDAAPDVTVLVNGTIVDRFHAATKDIERRITVHSRASEPDELTIETTRVVVPAAKGISGDRRTLGLRLNAIEWMPAR